MTLKRLTEPELEKLLEEAVGYRESVSNHYEVLGTFAERSVSASNLVIIELLQQVLDELKRNRL
jgi:hypothetical protein